MNVENYDIIYFKTKDNLLLHGGLIKTGKNNKNIIIHIHGMGGNFLKNPYNYNILKETKTTDFFTINTRAFGTINKFYKNKEKIYIGTALEKFTESVFDIDAAIKEMLNQNYKNIILSGHSTGCQKVIYYQNKKGNKNVKAIILLAPADDYNCTKEELGEKFQYLVKKAKKMNSIGKGNIPLEDLKNYYSSNRFLSYADPRNPESEIFNYETDLTTFSKIKDPILAFFGSCEENVSKKSPLQMLTKLKEKTNSTNLKTILIPKANHNFSSKEKTVTTKVIKFIKQNV